MYCSRTLHLYILRETLKVFILAAIAVNLVMNFAAILSFMHKIPLPMLALVKVVMFRMPQLFPWTFPMAMLLALTLTYGRMASDNEVMAMQASGIHMLWVILPGALLGAALSVGLYVVSDYLTPYCREKEYEVTRDEVANMLPEIFRSRRSFDFKRFQLAWDGVKDNTIHKLRVTQRDDKGATVMYCESETATFRMLQTTDPDTGKISYQLQLSGKKVSGMNYPDVRWTVQEKDQNIPLTDIEPHDPGATAGSIAELRQYQAQIEQSIPQDNDKLRELQATSQKTTETQIAETKEKLRNPDIDENEAHRLQMQLEGLNKTKDQTTDYYNRKIKENTKKLRDEKNNILVKIHTRLSLAASALALALVGIPLGVISGRSHMLKAFVVSCVPVLVIYYPLFLLGRNLAEQHVLSEAVALWAPTVVLTGAGVGLVAYIFRK